MREQGLVKDDGSVDADAAASLRGTLSPDEAAELHARAARYWMTAGPEHLLAALAQMRSVGTELPREELVALADHAGQMSLSLRDYSSAAELLKFAVELDSGDDPAALGRRLCDLAFALDGLGDVEQARECLVRAAGLGEMVGDSELIARAAVACCLPVDWYAGDDRSLALLSRASRMQLSDSARIQIDAARGLAEMRIPISPEEGQQLAWVTRPAVAQRLTEHALERSTGQEPEVQALALLAWRVTHRSPALLERRRTISRASLDQAQYVRQASYQVESAVWLAVDALESVDRGLYDEALSVARWVASRDSNPRLIWRAHTLSCGAAHLDGDLEAAEHWRDQAREVGSSVSVPGWLAADLMLFGQWVVSQQDLEVLRANLVDEAYPPLVNPIGRAIAALVHARVGQADVAERMVRRSLRQLDLESSYLMLITRCAAVVEVLGDKDLARQIADLLLPWSGRVAVDSNAWFCDGPVDRWLASMLLITGDLEGSSIFQASAKTASESLNDLRSITALSKLAPAIRPDRRLRTSRRPSEGEILTARQRVVLGLMAEGLTNAQIADKLAYSASTVRVETMVIYRALGVRSRAEAVAKATGLGLGAGAA